KMSRGRPRNDAEWVPRPSAAFRGFLSFRRQMRPIELRSQFEPPKTPKETPKTPKAFFEGKSIGDFSSLLGPFGGFSVNLICSCLKNALPPRLTMSARVEPVLLDLPVEVLLVDLRHAGRARDVAARSREDRLAVSDLEPREELGLRHRERRELA